jgi:hypothetical protein
MRGVSHGVGYRFQHWQQRRPLADHQSGCPRVFDGGVKVFLMPKAALRRSARRSALAGLVSGHQALFVEAWTEFFGV